MISRQRIEHAYQDARDALLAERIEAGHWVGELSTSALSTATAISALQLYLKNADEAEDCVPGLIEAGILYLVDHQNPDGGWGDTDKSRSNIATTMLCVAALTIADKTTLYAEQIANANQYIESEGGIPGLRRRYGKDKTFAVPILTNYALAGLVDWNEVSPLPFELACLPQKFYKLVKLPVVSYAIPALVAIGQARYFHAKPWNPVMRAIRGAVVNKSLAVLKRMQPATGGYLEAVPLTSFVVMSLASTERANHAVSKNGVRFLIDSVRPDGSWPIDTNLATWATTLSINAMAAGGDDLGQLDCLDWLLECQHLEVHPFTGAELGGWGWTDLDGAVPDADDTPGAIIALAHFYENAGLNEEEKQELTKAAMLGIQWLIDLQNGDGGWPTFCKGWGTQPFDRSGSDLTAHALRAIVAWKNILTEANWPSGIVHYRNSEKKLSPIRRVNKVIERGFQYLRKTQFADGSWLPLWFGNQDHREEENPIYGTVKVLAAYRDYNLMGSDEAKRAISWLQEQQNEDGGFGGGNSVITLCQGTSVSSIEETALAIEALTAAESLPAVEAVIDRAAGWLCEKIDQKTHTNCSPIGFYFSKLWYYERIYPHVFTVSALGHLLKRLQ
ncbi:MAG: squalene--hopene cyclase [Blastopirellula sp.]|nr:MAG: squalene--hopene cyclase [Blastopirellula sp.]